MKENKYDNDEFFHKYSSMERSVKGLDGAGEWSILKSMLPSFKNKRVLDIGCGFGWHCRYAVEQGADYVLGIDISKKMIERAKEYTKDKKIEYRVSAMEDFQVSHEEFDIVISSLAFHYVKDFHEICSKIKSCVKQGGDFIFSVEHPIFTANQAQDWHYNEDGEIMHWPIDNYQVEGMRRTNFLCEDVIKYHRTCETYINTLIENDFNIRKISELKFTKEMIYKNPWLKNEIRRPMFLIISAKKQSSYKTTEKV